MELFNQRWKFVLDQKPNMCLGILNMEQPTTSASRHETSYLELRGLHKTKIGSIIL